MCLILSAPYWLFTCDVHAVTYIFLHPSLIKCLYNYYSKVKHLPMRERGGGNPINNFLIFGEIRRISAISSWKKSLINIWNYVQHAKPWTQSNLFLSCFNLFSSSLTYHFSFPSLSCFITQCFNFPFFVLVVGSFSCTWGCLSLNRAWSCWFLICPCLYKQCRSRSLGFLRNKLIWIYTVCHQVCEFVSTTGSSNLLGLKLEVGFAS